MQKMVSFRLSRECREITINPAKVLYVCQYETGASSIHFGKDCQVRVQGDLAEVSARIEAALCDGPPPSFRPERSAEPEPVC